VSYLSAAAVVIHYEEALYQVYASLPFAGRKSATLTTESRLLLTGCPLVMESHGI